MDNLRLVLIVLGGVAIVALLIHGLYVMRKNNTPKAQWGENEDDMSPPAMDFSKSPRVEPQFDAEGFDEFGVGKPKVVSVTKPVEDETNLSVDQVSVTPVDDIPSVAELNDIPKTEVEPEPELEDDGPQYAPAVSNPKPAEHYQNKIKPVVTAEQPTSEFAPPPAEFSQADSAEEMLVSNEDTSNETNSANQEAPPLAPTDGKPLQPSDEVPQIKLEQEKPAEEKKEPQPKASFASKLFGSRTKQRTKQKKVDENQFSIDFDSVDPVLNEAKQQALAEQPKDTPVKPKYDPNIPPEVLAISVRTDNDGQITGARLLPLLLTLGLKFGDSDIFHRHVNNNGKGPVLFSLANMFKPGVFDIQNMETFETRGVTLFMTLPTESDAHQVFNMMHNAARKIADEFDATILNENREELTMAGLPQYVERIRDFEKRRLLG